MKPAAWSHTRLDNFENCERQFYETSVAKSIPFIQTTEMIWGNDVHKAFELRIRDKAPLPPELITHEPYMAWVEALPGKITVEEKIALDISGKPCKFFDKQVEVWFRGAIDVKVVHQNTARLLDYKTGKFHQKFGQLKLFALHTFILHPEVDTVRADYYWTQTKGTNGETYTREMIPALWSEFLPKLKRYANAFKTDVWRPKQSGLCRGWCPVKSCEFWSEKRSR